MMDELFESEPLWDMYDTSDYPEPDMSDMDWDDTPGPETVAYAKSLIGKYVVVADPEFLNWHKDFFGKVVRQGDGSRGGNAGQVHVRIFADTNMWSLWHWKHGPNEALTTCIHSCHLKETHRRPTIVEYLKHSIYILLRGSVSAGIKTRHFFRFFKSDIRGDISWHDGPIIILFKSCRDLYQWYVFGFDVEYGDFGGRRAFHDWMEEEREQRQRGVSIEEE